MIYFVNDKLAREKNKFLSRGKLRITFFWMYKKDLIKTNFYTKRSFILKWLHRSLNEKNDTLTREHILYSLSLQESNSFKEMLQKLKKKVQELKLYK